MKVAVVFFVFAIATIVVKAQNTPGGLSESHLPDPTVNELVALLRGQVETSVHEHFPEFKVISFKTQTVNGTNYFIKIKVGDHYIHIRAYKSLNGKVSLVNIEPQHQQADPLNFIPAA